MPTSYADLPPDTLFFPTEPHVEADEIQGSVLPGFGLPCQHHLFARITDTAAFKASLRALLPSVVSMGAVLSTRGAPAAPRRWLNVAFTVDGLRALGVPVDAAPLDEAFAQGMSARATTLGDLDPTRPAAAWRVGSDAAALHLVMLLASEGSATLDGFVASVKTALAGAVIVDELRGDTTALGGSREHFGYADGRAQPGVAGTYTAADGTRRAITPRRSARNRSEGYPGQHLSAPERFLTGRAQGTPPWMRNGSYLVARVLRQHVGTMHRFVFDAATALKVSPALVASRLLGRWPGGAPTLRADHDDLALGDAPCAYNDFRYLRASSPVMASPRPEDCAPTGAPAIADPTGAVCPFSAHIRKANPRDDEGRSPSTGAALSADHNRARVMLRRSLPYGPLSPSSFDAPLADGPGDDRGLVFLCYQSSIVEQFEFVQRGMIQDPDAPRAGSGHDALLGQASTGPRRFSLGVLPDGRPVQCEGVSPWVTTRGGGYFFAPSIPALSAMLT